MGGRPDRETILYYRPIRHYSPSLDPFVLRDLSEYAASADPYEYCGSDPVGYVDPSGLHDQSECRPKIKCPKGCVQVLKARKKACMPKVIVPGPKASSICFGQCIACNDRLDLGKQACMTCCAECHKRVGGYLAGCYLGCNILG